jgi:hypothetical protein
MKRRVVVVLAVLAMLFIGSVPASALSPSDLVPMQVELGLGC